MTGPENKDTNDYNVTQGWASNFRKYRWINLVLPVLTPFGLISLFLFGFWTLAVVGYITAAFCWFDLAKTAKTERKRKAWKVFTGVLLLMATYFVAISVNPALLG